MDVGKAPIAEGSVHPEVADEVRATCDRWISGYNTRSLQQMLSVADPEIVLRPSRVFGAEVYKGHEGMATWWGLVDATNAWYEIVVSEVLRVERRKGQRRAAVEPPKDATAQGEQRKRGPDRRQAAWDKIVMFGELCLEDEVLAPWASIVTIRDGLVIEDVGYLSPRTLLEDIDVLAWPRA